MKAFVLFYPLSSQAIREEELLALVEKLPEAKRVSLSRTSHRETHLHTLTGLYLLQQAMQLAGNDRFSLQQLVYPQQGKPSTSDNYDFNISHSHDYVVCAVGRDIKLGIDIEEKRSIDASRFGRYFSRQLLDDIQAQPDLFFLYWTQKEAVAKASGAGIRALSSIELKGAQALYQQTPWYLSEIKITDNYACSLACSENEVDIQVLEYTG